MVDCVSEATGGLIVLARFNNQKKKNEKKMDEEKKKKKLKWKTGASKSICMHSFDESQMLAASYICCIKAFAVSGRVSSIV